MTISLLEAQIRTQSVAAVNGSQSPFFHFVSLLTGVAISFVSSVTCARRSPQDDDFHVLRVLARMASDNLLCVLPGAHELSGTRKEMLTIDSSTLVVYQQFNTPAVKQALQNSLRTSSSSVVRVRTMPGMRSSRLYASVHESIALVSFLRAG